MRKITCKKENKDVIIKIPIKLLLFAIQDERRINYSPIKIIDKEKFIKGFCKRIFDVGEQEDGSTSLDRLFDDTAQDMYESGDLSIEGVEVEEDKNYLI